MCKTTTKVRSKGTYIVVRKYTRAHPVLITVFNYEITMIYVYHIEIFKLKHG